MKIAGSSASFAREIASGDLTQLEWLDLCAHELELDGVAFDVDHFPRTDAEYVAHLKKLAVDLGLTVAALVDGAFFARDPVASLALAAALGAPLVIAPAAAANGDPAAWGSFADDAKRAASAAKRANVTLAVRDAPDTLCTDAAALKMLAKDVDSAWLRFAPDASLVGGASRGVLAKTVIARCALERPDRFGTPEDSAAPALVRDLAPFRGFVVIDRDDRDGPRDAYHEALQRFRATLAKASLE